MPGTIADRMKVAIIGEEESDIKVKEYDIFLLSSE